MTPGPIAVTPATIVHAELLADLHRLSFADQNREPWDAETMRRAVTTAGGFALIAVQSNVGADEVPVAFAVGRAIAGEAELFSIGAPPERRGRGVARRLLRAFHAEARVRGAEKAFLEVAEDNEPALALYRSAGYRQVGRRDGYYRGPERSVAALVLTMDLAGDLMGDMADNLAGDR